MDFYLLLFTVIHDRHRISPPISKLLPEPPPHPLHFAADRGIRLNYYFTENVVPIRLSLETGVFK